MEPENRKLWSPEDKQRQVTLDARGFSCLNTWRMQRTGVLSVQKPNLIWFSYLACWFFSLRSISGLKSIPASFPHQIKLTGNIDEQLRWRKARTLLKSIPQTGTVHLVDLLLNKILICLDKYGFLKKAWKKHFYTEPSNQWDQKNNVFHAQTG